MTMGVKLLLFAVIGLTLTQAKTTERKTKWDEIMTMACFHELSDYQWDSSESHRSVLCNYMPALGSWVHCAVVNYSERMSSMNSELIYGRINSSCHSKWHSDEQIDLNELFHSTVKTIKEIEDEASPISYTVYPNEQSLGKWIATMYGPVDNLDKGTLFGGLIFAYWIFILGAAACLNLCKMLHKGYESNPKLAWFKAKIAFPPLKQKHAAYFGKGVFIGLAPTRLETIIIITYIILHITLMSIGYHFDRYELVSSLNAQISVFIADRAGIVAFAHLPFIILSGGRNQIIQSITGIKFKTMIAFHKWTGRMMFTDVLIHAGGYICHSIAEDYMKYAWNSPVWKSGRLGVYTSGILILFSFYYFRLHFYETFLFVHFLMAITFIYACWKHCSQVGWMEWVYVAIGIWCFELILRIYRCIKFGFPNATIETSGNDHIKIKIPKPNEGWKSKPGQYVYLYFFKPSMFWQSHPFSILETSDDTGDTTLTIVATVKNGITKRLKNMVENTGTIQLRVAVEGPYGNHIPFQEYENVLLIGGGTGIASLTSIALTSLKSEGKRDRFLELVWSMKSTALLSIYEKEILRLSENSVDTKIYLTSKAKSETFSEMEMSDMSTPDDRLLASNANIPITGHQRPNIEEILNHFNILEGSSLVVTCGPPSFVDNVRRLTCQTIIKNPTKLIDYEEDLQIW